ncbi:MAG TPA: MerR family transcriptional regulator [Acidimicrobiales bacterium]|nr:MerR family transcriptional regulator [Acidimicrobiales bacterium]
MSSRTYLSIGDVLTLLREEFPDVTISKIRFLESQGLVNPERSPSGYRKFFEHDVERLRWVLRQQREHFLPLKVIRDRLADGELDDLSPKRANGKSSETAGRHAAAIAPEDEQPTKADEEAMARILADASRRSALMPETAQARRGLQVVGEGAAPTSATAAAAATAPTAAATPATPEAAPARGPAAPGPATGTEGGAGRATPASGPGRPEVAVSAGAAGTASAPGAARPAAPDRSEGPRPDRGAPRTERAPSAAPADAAARPHAPAASTPSARPASTRGGEAAAGAATTGVVTGASLTAEELCAASGLTAEELAGLEGFGLICPVRVAGLETYDEEALTVANLAAAFRAFGIEPRHLRQYRNAADRELGLIEQIVIPLLRQRNPESRQRATEGAEQLAALGQSMRASLLRQALRQHLGG